MTRWERNKVISQYWYAWAMNQRERRRVLAIREHGRQVWEAKPGNYAIDTEGHLHGTHSVN